MLKRAHAAEPLSPEEEYVSTALFGFDLLDKSRRGSLSQEDVTQLIDNLPEILKLYRLNNPTDVRIYQRLRASTFNGMDGDDLVMEILQNLRRYVGGETSIANEEFGKRVYYRPRTSENEQAVSAITDKLVRLGLTERNYRAQRNLLRMFERFDDLRVPILEKIIQADQPDKDWTYESLAYEIKNNIVPKHYSGPLSNVRGFGGAANEKKLAEELESGRDKLVSRILELLAQQYKGAGNLVGNLTIGLDSQRPAWLFAKQIIAHPELTPQLAAVYNNSNPAFDGFRDLVNQTTYAYGAESPEDKAFDAIKREARAGGSSRVQE